MRFLCFYLRISVRKNKFITTDRGSSLTLCKFQYVCKYIYIYIYLCVCFRVCIYTEIRHAYGLGRVRSLVYVFTILQGRFTSPQPPQRPLDADDPFASLRPERGIFLFGRLLKRFCSCFVFGPPFFPKSLQKNLRVA